MPELPMSMFSRNVSFRAVHLMWLTADVTAGLLEKTMRLLDDGSIQPPQPLHLFGLPDLTKALSQYVVERRRYSFDKDASLACGVRVFAPECDVSSSASYTAGCAFQDALAHHREVVCGERALSIDICWIGNIGVIAEDIQPSKPLSSYGVDSLMAVELRNWIGREFSATMAVFDIVGGVPISSVVKLVAQRVRPRAARRRVISGRVVVE
ncbi:hypothetical protein B0H63DRAFT_522832 [Podospora didyma]|uniref:Carrier domain-containing protein n=1 Tax=Podospora didyma TaxID=330526 RepID=A0AAE0NQ47_9PEZI|nr:hypothetical protein B0H63DRAFT_522832 [Podospora didyma]